MLFCHLKHGTCFDLIENDLRAGRKARRARYLRRFPIWVFYRLYFRSMRIRWISLIEMTLNSTLEKIMKPSKLLAMFLLCGSVLLMAQESVTAEPLSPNFPPKIYQTPDFKLCADLKASLTLTKGPYGMVTVFGTVTNVGKGSCNMPSVAEVIMNLAYAPKYSYAMSGVSVVLATKPFTALSAGASFKVNSSYQIPDFGGWATDNVQGNALRLFTLRVIKQDGSPYKTGEDCDPANNAASFELAYRDLKH